MTISKMVPEILIFFMATLIVVQPAIGQSASMSNMLENVPIDKVTIFSMSSSVFTRFPVNEEYLRTHGCKFETKSDKKLEEIRNIISENIFIDTGSTRYPSDVRTAIYLHMQDGSSQRYLLDRKEEEEGIYGYLYTSDKFTSVIATVKIVEAISQWAEPDYLLQKKANPCF